MQLLLLYNTLICGLICKQRKSHQKRINAVRQSNVLLCFRRLGAICVRLSASYLRYYEKILMTF